MYTVRARDAVHRWSKHTKLDQLQPCTVAHRSYIYWSIHNVHYYKVGQTAKRLRWSIRCACYKTASTQSDTGEYRCVNYWSATKRISRFRLTTRKCGNYNDVLPLNATRRDSISNLTFWGLHIWAANEPSAVSSRVAVRHHVNAS